MPSSGIRFRPGSFTRESQDGDETILGVNGTWSADIPIEVGEVRLMVDSGESLEWFTPIGEPPLAGARPGGVRWGARFSIPTALLGGPDGALFALETDTGASVPLPELSAPERPSIGASVAAAPAFLVVAGAGLAAVAFSLTILGLLALQPRILPVLAIALLAGAWLIARPHWILPLFIGVAWASLPGSLFGSLPSPVEFGGLVLAGVGTWFMLTRLDLAAEVLAVIALLALPVIVSGLMSPEGSAVPYDALRDLMFLFIAAMCVRTAGDVDRVAVALTFTALILGLGAISSVLIGPTDLFPLSVEPEEFVDREAPRAAGPFGEPNFFALSLAALTPMALYMVAGPVNWRRWIGAAALVAVAGGILAAGSRGAALSMAFALVAMALTVRDWRVRGAALSAVLIAVALVPLFAGQTQSSADRSVSGRATENQIALAMLSDHPITGVGPTKYQVLYRDYSRDIGDDPRPNREAHSLPLQIAAEQGIVGMIGWACAALLVLTFSLRRGVWRLPLGKALMLSTATYLVGSLFLHGSQLRLLYMLVGLTLAYAAALPAPATATRRARLLPAPA